MVSLDLSLFFSFFLINPLYIYSKYKVSSAYHPSFKLCLLNETDLKSHLFSFILEDTINYTNIVFYFRCPRKLKNVG